MLLAGRVRKPEEEAVILSILAKNFKRTVKPEELFSQKQLTSQFSECGAAAVRTRPQRDGPCFAPTLAVCQRFTMNQEVSIATAGYSKGKKRYNAICKGLRDELGGQLALARE